MDSESFVLDDADDRLPRHLRGVEPRALVPRGGYEPPPVWALPDATRPIGRPNGLRALDGSWFIQIDKTTNPHVMNRDADTESPLRGALRLESDGTRIEISADLYEDDGVDDRHERPHIGDPLRIGDSWYPQFPVEKYRYALQSAGVLYDRGHLLCAMDAYRWHPANREQRDPAEFYPRFPAQLHLYWDGRFHDCSALTGAAGASAAPVMAGWLTLGDSVRRAIAVWSAPYYRGCRIDVELAHQQFWVDRAETSSGVFTLDGVYRRHGIDIDLRVFKGSLTCDALVTEKWLREGLPAQLASQRAKRGKRGEEPAPHHWRTALAVLTHPAFYTQDNTLLYGPYSYAVEYDEIHDVWRHRSELDRSRPISGIMPDEHDKRFEAPFREFATMFASRTINRKWHMHAIHKDFRNLVFQRVPAAFLRIAIHEIGHALGLPHSPLPDTLMSQTGAVIDTALTGAPLFPHNIRFEFDEAGRKRLLHAPDVDVAPGRLDFGPIPYEGKGAVTRRYRWAPPPDRPEPMVELHLGWEDDARLESGHILMIPIRLTNVGDDQVEVDTPLVPGSECFGLSVSTWRKSGQLYQQVDLAPTVRTYRKRRRVILPPRAVLRDSALVLLRLDQTPYLPSMGLGLPTVQPRDYPHLLQAAYEFERGSFVRSPLYTMRIAEPTARAGTQEMDEDAVGRALRLGPVDAAARATLAGLARDLPQSLDGKLAALLLAPSGERRSQDPALFEAVFGEAQVTEAEF